MLTFPFNLYLAAALAGMLVTAGSLPFWRRWCQKIGMVDHPGHRKIHASTTPLAGGLAVLSGFLLPLVGALLAGLFSGSLPLPLALSYGLSERFVQLLTLLLGSIAMVLLGSADDRLELSPAIKFGGQLLIALATAASGIRISLFVPNDLFSYLITVLWILTITNALNFLDNMNGLCAGLGLIACWACGWSAAFQGQYLVALLAFQLSGALLGYLPFNFPKASVFLGDSGSHLVGYLTAVLAILPNYYQEGSTPKLAVISPLIILAVPLFDLASVVIIRTRNRRPFWIGDTNHISHRLTARGLSRTQAVLTIWLAAAAGSLVALALSF